MPRIACVILPHLDVQSLVRADPELEGAPLVVVSGTGGNGRVIDVSEAAARLGVREGATVSEVRSLAPEAVLRPRAEALVRATTDALVDLGASFSPRVEACGGEIYLDVDGLTRLFESEAHLAESLRHAARRLRLDARIGLAGDKATARVAAGSAPGPDDAARVVPPGREAAFLAPLPVGRLAPTEETAAMLRRWGVRAIGELASLPSGGVALRLGAEGARLARVARGQGDEPLAPRAEPPRFEEAADLEWPVESADALVFVLRRLVENVVARLACRGLSAGALTLTLVLERGWLDPAARAGSGCDVRAVTLAAPTREVATLLTLLRLQLESSPPSMSAPIAGVRLTVAPAHARAAQLGLFSPAGPSPDKLATTLARLSALVGEDRVGSPSLPDRHLPDAFTLQPFTPNANAANANVTNANVTNANVTNANVTNANVTNANAVRILGLHALRPPLPAEPRLDRGRLRYLFADGIAGQVLSLAGPFRVRDGWWTQPLLRDYYDVELSDGAVYRVYHDRVADRWHIDGIYE
jgi:protein ImuB